MALIIADSFDWYSTVNELFNSQYGSVYWSNGSTTYSGITTSYTKWGYGKSLYGGTGNATQNSLFKTIGSEENTFFISFYSLWRYNSSGTAYGWLFRFYNGTGDQCCVHFYHSDSPAGVPNISVRTGAYNGTVRATFTGVASYDTWHHYQMKVVIHPTAGSVEIRKDGSPTNTYEVFNINTSGVGSGGATSLNLRCGISTHYLDDFVFHTGSGAAPTDWIGEVRSYPIKLSADTAQKDLQAGGSIATTTFNLYGSTNSTHTRIAGRIDFSPVWPTINGFVDYVTVEINAAFTGNIKAAIYESNGSPVGGNTVMYGFPSNLIAVSDTVSNPTGYTNFTFTDPIPIEAGKEYWVGVMADVDYGLRYQLSAIYKYSATQVIPYASGFPSVAASGQFLSDDMFGISMTVSEGDIGDNYLYIDEPIHDDNASYVFSDTPNHKDIYEMNNLPTNPTSIVAVQTRAYTRKADAGTRGLQIGLKTGGTEYLTSDTALSTSWQFINRTDTVNPNTGAAWTGAEVNALQGVVKVSS